MKTESHATKNIEITKGCVLNEKFFITKVQGSQYEYLTPDGCYIHEDDKIYSRQVKTHEVRICICNSADNCNKDDIDGTGREDIEYRNSQKTSGAPTQHFNFGLPLVLIFITNQISKK